MAKSLQCFTIKFHNNGFHKWFRSGRWSVLLKVNEYFTGRWTFSTFYSVTTWNWNGPKIIHYIAKSLWTPILSRVRKHIWKWKKMYWLWSKKSLISSSATIKRYIISMQFNCAINVISVWIQLAFGRPSDKVLLTYHFELISEISIRHNCNSAYRACPPKNQCEGMDGIRQRRKQDFRGNFEYDATSILLHCEEGVPRVVKKFCTKKKK